MSEVRNDVAKLMPEKKDILGCSDERGYFINGGNEAISACTDAVVGRCVGREEIDKLIDNAIGDEMGYHRDDTGVFTAIAEALRREFIIIRKDKGDK